MWYRFLPLIILYSPAVLALYVTNDTIITGNTDYDEDVEVESNNSLKLLDGTKHIFQENLNVDLNSLLYIYNHNNGSLASGTTFNVTGSTSSFVNYGNVTMDDSNANALTGVNWTPENFQNHGTISLMASSNNQIYNGVSTFSLQPVSNFNNYGTLSFSNAEIIASSGSFLNSGTVIINMGSIYVQESVISDKSSGNFTLDSGTLWIKDPTAFATQSITLQSGGSVIVDPTISAGPIQVDGFYQENVIGFTSNITDYQYDTQSGILNLTSQENTISFDIGSCYSTDNFSIVSNSIQFASQQFDITYIIYNLESPSGTCSSATSSDSSITTSEYFTTVTNTVVVSLLQIDYVAGKTSYTTSTIAAASSISPNADSSSSSGSGSGSGSESGSGSDSGSGSGSGSVSASASVSVSGSVSATGMGSSLTDNTAGSGSVAASETLSGTVIATGVGSSLSAYKSSRTGSGSDSSPGSGSVAASETLSGTVTTGLGSSFKGYNSSSSKPWLNATSAGAALFNTSSSSAGTITKRIESSSGSVSSNVSSSTLTTIQATSNINQTSVASETFSITATTSEVTLKNANSLAVNKVPSAAIADVEEYSSTTTTATLSQAVTTVLTKSTTPAESTNDGESTPKSTSASGISVNGDDISSSMSDYNAEKSHTSSSKNSNTIAGEGTSSSAPAVHITSSTGENTVPNEVTSSVTSTGVPKTETSFVTSATPIVAISTISSSSQQKLQVLTSITTTGTTTAAGPISLYEAGAVGSQSIINKTWTAILGLLVVTFLN